MLPKLYSRIFTSITRCQNSTFLSLFIFLLNFCFSSDLIAETTEQRNIINTLQKDVEKTSLFYGCTFTLFDPDLHPEYQNNLEKLKKERDPIYKRLTSELEYNRLYYFAQFKERVNVSNQYAYLKKEESDYCILYAKEYWAKKEPKNTKKQKEYDEDLQACNIKYKTYNQKLNQLNNKIDKEFLIYYSLGYSKNDFRKIYDHGLLNLVTGNVEEAVALADELIEQLKLINKDLNYLSSEELLNLGITFNEAIEYSKAIDYLNHSIQKDPNNKEAYFQRAIAHFELGNFDKAVVDYLISERQNDSIQTNCKLPPHLLKKAIEGLVDGSKDAVINFIPSLYSFAYANVFHPVNQVNNYMNACYELMIVVSESLKEADFTNFDHIEYIGLSNFVLQPQLKNLYDKFDKLNEEEKIYAFTYVIGSLGIDFVGGSAIVKGFQNAAKLTKACQNVRKAGRIYELETLANSGANSEVIMTEALDRLKVRENICDLAKNGGIVVRNPNAQFHILQEKHAWDKVVPITGNHTNDCSSIIRFIEDNKIVNESNLTRRIPTNDGKLLIKIYEKQLGDIKIRIYMEEFVESGQSFLKNGYIVTRE